MKRIFDGVCTAIVTPFKNNKVDYDGFKILINKQIDDGGSARTWI